LLLRLGPSRRAHNQLGVLLWGGFFFVFVGWVLLALVAPFPPRAFQKFEVKTNRTSTAFSLWPLPHFLASHASRPLSFGHNSSASTPSCFWEYPQSPAGRALHTSPRKAVPSLPLFSIPHRRTFPFCACRSPCSLPHTVFRSSSMRQKNLQ